MLKRKRASKPIGDIAISLRIFLFGAILASIFNSAFLSTSASSQEAKLSSERPGNIIHVLTGTGRSTTAYLADDMRSWFSLSTDIQLLPSIGNGDITNIENILSWNFVDLAFLHYDALMYFADSGVVQNSKEKLVYLTITHNEEFHLLARADISKLSMLEGKKVNIGPNIDGTYITATEIFHRNGISITAMNLPHMEAYRLLKDGEIDAMAIVDGSPSDLLELASLDDGIRLLDVPAEGIGDTYRRTELNNSDYPKLLAPGDSVETIAVPTVLVAYNWPEGSARRLALDKFAEAFMTSLPALRASDREFFHPKWREVDLWGKLPGRWRRDPHMLKLANPMKRFESKSSN